MWAVIPPKLFVYSLLHHKSGRRPAGFVFGPFAARLAYGLIQIRYEGPLTDARGSVPEATQGEVRLIPAKPGGQVPD